MPKFGEYLKHFAFEGVVRTDDADLAGKVSEVGSVS